MVDRTRYPHEAKGGRDGESLHFSDPMICHSAAGYYIGRECWVETAVGGYPEPGSRESDYYASRKAAELDLESGRFGRDCIENRYMHLTMGVPHNGPNHLKQAEGAAGREASMEHLQDWGDRER